MKALLIKYVPPTARFNACLRVTCEQQPPRMFLVDSFDSNSGKCVEELAAIEYMKVNNLNWLKRCNFAIGQLPNGDHCAVLVEKIETV